MQLWPQEWAAPIWGRHSGAWGDYGVQLAHDGDLHLDSLPLGVQ